MSPARRLTEDDVVVDRICEQEDLVAFGGEEAARVAVQRIAVGIGKGEIADPGAVDCNDVAVALRGTDCVVRVEAQGGQPRRERRRQRRDSNVVIIGVPRDVRGHHAVLQASGLVVRNRCSGRFNEIFGHGSNPLVLA